MSAQVASYDTVLGGQERDPVVPEVGAAAVARLDEDDFWFGAEGVAETVVFIVRFLAQSGYVGHFRSAVEGVSGWWFCWRRCRAAGEGRPTRYLRIDMIAGPGRREGRR